jgi:uncharacterized membrane protein
MKTITADTDRLSLSAQFAALEEAFAAGELTDEEFRAIERSLEAQESR